MMVITGVAAGAITLEREVVRISNAGPVKARLITGATNHVG